MRITWKDGLTTISAGGAVVLERAYYHDYDWPLVSSMRWVIGGLAILGAISLVAGFAFDKYTSANWDVLGIFFAVLIATLTTIGLLVTVSAYVALLMASTVAVWAASIAHHAVEHTDARRLTPHGLSHA
jgi:uncharacterized membrane protein YqgA involved in biofilm formation